MDGTAPGERRGGSSLAGSKGAVSKEALAKDSVEERIRRRDCLAMLRLLWHTGPAPGNGRPAGVGAA